MPYLVSSIILGLSLFAIVVFASWIRARAGFSTDERVKSWDVFAKLLTAIIAIVAGVFALLRYTDQQYQEMRRELRVEKSGIYQAAIRSSSKLAAVDALNNSDALQARSDFEQLYWGAMVTVEGKAVEQAMIEFRKALEAWKESSSKPSNMGPLALAIASSCKEELNQLR